MGEEGQVIKVTKEYITIRMVRQEACAKCGACAAGLRENEMLIDAINHCSAKEGDWVNVELSSKSFLKAVLIMYGIPFLFLVAGFVVGYCFPTLLKFNNSNELIGFFSGILLMIFAYMLIKRNEHKFNKDGRLSPVATRVTKTSSSL